MVATLSAKRILIIDDDALMRRSVSVSLDQAGYQTVTAANAEEALRLVERDQPDLVLLDIGLPGMDGMEAMRQLRHQTPALPVIFVTARRRELDEIVGLELGADDYITKPFDMDVLLAHVKAVLRRAQSAPAVPVKQPVQVGDLRIDPIAHEVTIDDKPVDLSPKEFDLLFALAQRPNQVLAVDELLEQVWGAAWIGESQTLYVHVRWLREKIEDDPAHPRRLVTMRGAGYKLVEV